MLKLFVLLGLIAAVFGVPADFVEWEGRIVGGKEATPGQFPFIASLRSQFNSHFCAGTILSNRFVLSAAHCTVGRATTNTRVVVGAHNRITGGVNHATFRITNHPQYNRFTMQNDISVIQTSTEIVYSPTVQPIKLGVENLAGGQQSTAIGWGQTSHPGSLAANLQFVGKTIIANSVCQETWAQVGDGHICTFEGTGIGTCMGDSGGPLVYNNAVQGAVSFGRPCARGAPDVYARVSFYNAWILGVTGPLQ